MIESIGNLLVEKISGEWGSDPTPENSVKVLRTTNFTNYGQVSWEKVVERAIDPKKVARKHLKWGDIIIEKSGGSPSQPVGRVIFFDLESEEKILTNNFTALLRPDPNKVCPKYLFYRLLLAHRFGLTLRYQNKTTGIINLSLDDYLKEKIELPSRADQQKVAVLFSSLQTLLAQRKESLELLDRFVKSTFKEMFGGYQGKNIFKLHFLAEINSGLTKGKNYAEKETEFVPYMRVANVQDGHIDLTEIKEIEATKSEIERFTLKTDDLLLTEGGDPDKLGRGALWKGQIPNCIFQNHIFRVRVFDSKQLNPTFLSYQTSSNYGKAYFLKMAKQTTGIASINSTQLKNFPVFIPPSDLQLQFAQIVEKVGAIKTQYIGSLRELENLYGSLCQKAFKGELTFEPNGGKLDSQLLAANLSDEPYTGTLMGDPDAVEPVKLEPDPKKNNQEDISAFETADIRPYGPEHVLEEIEPVEERFLKESSAIPWPEVLKESFRDKPITAKEAQSIVLGLGYDFSYDHFSMAIFSGLQGPDKYLKLQYVEGDKKEVTVVLDYEAPVLQA